MTARRWFRHRSPVIHDPIPCPTCASAMRLVFNRGEEQAWWCDRDDEAVFFGDERRIKLGMLYQIAEQDSAATGEPLNVPHQLREMLS